MFDTNSPFIYPQPKSESLADLGCRLIAASIVEGDPSPGTILSEAEISARFGTGMAATRTALARLSAIGWVEAKDRRGWMIQPVSPAHLADLRSARDCLEPVLPGLPCTGPLSDALCRQADIHEGSAHASSPRVLLHLERQLLTLIAQVVAAPRLRGWLTDTWDLSLRADYHFACSMGIVRAPLPLPALARATACADANGTARITDTMRFEFAARVAHALSRSDGPIKNTPAPVKAQRTGGIKNATSSRPNHSPTKGDRE